MSPIVKSFLTLSFLGLLGVVTLLFAPSTLPIPDKVAAEAGGAENLRLLLLAQPALMTMLATGLGLAVAHKVGLRSAIVDWFDGDQESSVARNLTPPLLGGFAAGIFLIVGDLLFSPWTGDALAKVAVAPGGRVAALLTGVLYGGLTEELIVRWGLMSLIAFVLHRLGMAADRAIIMALGLAALLFALGHLPALGAAVELTPILVMRTVILNAVPGMIFGWLFWKHRLEAAFAAHAVAHVTLYVARLFGLTF